MDPVLEGTAPSARRRVTSAARARRIGRRAGGRPAPSSTAATASRQRSSTSRSGRSRKRSIIAAVRASTSSVSTSSTGDRPPGPAATPAPRCARRATRAQAVRRDDVVLRRVERRRARGRGAALRPRRDAARPRSRHRLSRRGRLAQRRGRLASPRARRATPRPREAVDLVGEVGPAPQQLLDRRDLRRVAGCRWRARPGAPRATRSSSVTGCAPLRLSSAAATRRKPRRSRDLAVPFGDAELDRDLAIGTAAEVRELDRFALLARQAVHRCSDLLGREDRGGELLDVGHRVARRAASRWVAAASCLLPSDVVDGAPVGERREPRPQRARGRSRTPPDAPTARRTPPG